MKNTFKLLSLIFTFAFLAAACTEKIDEGGATGGGEQMSFLISLPEAFTGAAGDIVSVKFYSGKGPKDGDVVVLKNSSPIVFVCEPLLMQKLYFPVETSEETLKLNLSDVIATISHTHSDEEFLRTTTSPSLGPLPE